ncbi:TOBE domain-containing protein [Natrinema pellirubrum DSM 15624]|uniref:Molybdenum-binding protein n=1 Tax=Natrinema pellirubrum (strain DSM 15624 / CIP 106293 / JCM 10476 / NCIMB 786 / 157) TaxID=797303 RepID=L0JQ33_NATP1|nr:TOBE domain-containing protein [Natrinema pellirubrum]AGB32491.1 molybdenum-binding protein [Natrinema pellirubrum DSM 15624]ELY73630.1 TOBE domain-containing protein [Natrinema pellirubrum DSM 15624]
MEKEFDPYLRIDDVTVDRSDVAMLRAIDDRGSLSGAAEALERSYPRLQQRVVELEDAIGPLVERTRGGAGGGGSSLTERARDLLARFDRLVAAYEGVARVDETVLSGPVVDRDGELATVATAAGEVLAVVPGEAATVSVTIRSDAVSLHAPEDVPRAEGTSVRNRFPGTVSWLEAGDAVARVGIALEAAEDGDDADDAELVALVTRRSVDALGLEPGRSIVASVKATAVRGVARDT